MVCRLSISPKRLTFVTTFRAPLREMKMVNRNVWWWWEEGAEEGWLPGWLDAITAAI